MLRSASLTIVVLALAVACGGEAGGSARTDSAGTGSAGTGSAASTPAAQPDTALPPDMVSAGSTPVYSSAQAARGEKAWPATCGRCHALTQLSGSAFDAGWNRRKVSQLFERVRTTMPLDDPGSLPDQDYIDIVAYVLKVNGMPAGTTELAPDPAALRKIRIDVPRSSTPSP